MLQGLFLSVTIILAVLTLLPLWSYPAWWVRGLDFPRLQLAIFSLLLLILGAFLLNLTMISTWCMLAIITLCFCYQAWWITVYNSLPHGSEIATEQRLSKNDQDYHGQRPHP